jgi:hypothetical protein
MQIGPTQNLDKVINTYCCNLFSTVRLLHLSQNQRNANCAKGEWRCMLGLHYVRYSVRHSYCIIIEWFLIILQEKRRLDFRSLGNMTAFSA